MKCLVLVLLAVVAAACAAVVPENSLVNYDEEGQRFIGGIITRVIEDLSEQLREAGLDPLEIQRRDFQYTVVPILVVIRAHLQNLYFNGLSNIDVRRMRFSVITNRLKFDICLPELELDIGEAGVSARVFADRYEGSYSGSLVVRDICLNGEVKVNMGIISGVFVSDLNLDFSIRNIQSDVKVIILGQDYSDDANQALSQLIPDFLKENRNEINLRLEKFVWDIINEYL